MGYVNSAGEALLHAGDSLNVSGGRLRALDEGADQALARLIHEALTQNKTHGGYTALPKLNGPRPLSARVLPLPPDEEVLPESVLRVSIFVTDPCRYSAGMVKSAAVAYGLTPAESRLLNVLVTGASIREAAGKLGVAQVTARNHLARVMTKTGTKRQVDLVRLVLASHVPVG
ncbi:MAG: helix-turn-helix transcriptional regulator [Rhodomicrobium sp.]|nr:helix-turn-helix transcriptional regulator [Rhodomicrobium sp.]